VPCVLSRIVARVRNDAGRGGVHDTNTSVATSNFATSSTASGSILATKVIQNEFTDARFTDEGENWNGEENTDHAEDSVTNEYFNIPAHVSVDY
jgi:hypothetical protein